MEHRQNYCCSTFSKTNMDLNKKETENDFIYISRIDNDLDKNTLHYLLVLSAVAHQNEHDRPLYENNVTSRNGVFCTSFWKNQIHRMISTYKFIRVSIKRTSQTNPTLSRCLKHAFLSLSINKRISRHQVLLDFVSSTISRKRTVTTIRV